MLQTGQIMCGWKSTQNLNKDGLSVMEANVMTSCFMNRAGERN